MSLISDALKRARQEAARQDSLRQGLPYAVGVADPPVRRAPWISLLAGLGAGCLLAAAVFATAFFTGWGPFHKPGVETRVAAAPAVPAPSAPAPTPQPATAVLPTPPPVKTTVVEAPAPKREPRREPEAVRPAPQAEAPPPAVIVRHPTPALEPAAPPAASAPVPPIQAETPAPVPATPAPIAPPQSTPAASTTGSGGLVEGSTYTGEVPVPGGGSVKLNGIVFSPDHPIAVLDGRVMAPGENVQGFTVVAIESGRVKLQGHGMTVYLSPK